MGSIEGQWDCTQQSPMGERKSIITLEGDEHGGVTGTNIGAAGTMEITDVKIEGDKVTFIMKVTSPMKINVKVQAVLAGDTLEGKASAGVFGSFPMRATRKT
jgi:hypothetical protein